jgi:CRISPR-associated protein Cmr2
MSDRVYTAITFAPVQGFIEKSRKLRDLYGSSYLLSFLSQSVCTAAEAHPGCNVVSPALPNITQGMPNQIIISGLFPEAEAKATFFEAWQCVTETCRQWIEDEVKENWTYYWQREWGLWAKYAWEFFWVKGEPEESITDVRQRLNEAKRSRNWTGVNWVGESSTLSGTDAVAWPELGKIIDPRNYDYPWQKDTATDKSPVEKFYERLSQRLGETFIEATPGLHRLSASKKAELSIEYGSAFIDPDEELNVPELTKRLITHKAIVQKLIEKLENHTYLQDLLTQVENDLSPETFKDLNRLQHKKRGQKQQSSKTATEDEQYWTGWFQGDGDGASDYLKWLGRQGAEREDQGTKDFSHQMRHWGQELKQNASQHLPNKQSRIIYAGGDDFLGVLYRTDEQLSPKVCLDWFTTFKSDIWEGINPDNSGEKQITPSVGFVWVSPKVPQRDVLQHCRVAEQLAKRNGKDRIAFRIVFAGGNYLEWVCPWRILAEGLFKQYRDRNGVQGISKGANWIHFFNDVAVLESRHAFGGKHDAQTEIVVALFKVYFGENNDLLSDKNWWNIRNVENPYKIERAGILGDEKSYHKNGILDQQKIAGAINNWVINLAKVGFYLCSDT